MPMQELVVPVFGGRALLNVMKPLCVVGGRGVPSPKACFTSGSMTCPWGADEGPELRPGSWIPFRGGICGAVGVAGRLPSPYTGLREHSLQVSVALG